MREFHVCNKELSQCTYQGPRGYGSSVTDGGINRKGAQHPQPRPERPNWIQSHCTTKMTIRELLTGYWVAWSSTVNKRLMEKAIHALVGDVPDIGSSKSRLWWSRSCFQCLLDSTVLLEKQTSTQHPCIVSPDTDCLAVSIGSILIWTVDDWSNPEINGVSGHLFFLTVVETEWFKQAE